MLLIKKRAAFLLFFTTVTSQRPEINDQFVEAKTNGTEITDAPKSNVTKQSINKVNATRKYGQEVEEPMFIIRIYKMVEHSVKQFLSSKKVSFVIHNIGTCVVNGVMEIITFYLPAPMIPLLASAAGMVIPFEPVVTLRERMPVTSYRKAFNSAVNSFMGTFDKYKMDDTEDPYMTRRFNRRFMNDNGSREKKRDDS